MKKNLVSLIVLSMLSFPLLAVTVDENKLVTRLKVQAEDKAYIRVSGGLSASCLYDAAFFDVSTASGKGYLSVLLAAKMAHKQVTVDYVKEANDICTVLGVAVD